MHGDGKASAISRPCIVPVCSKIVPEKAVITAADDGVGVRNDSCSICSKRRS